MKNVNDLIAKVNSLELSNQDDLATVVNWCNGISDERIMPALFRLFERYPEFNFGSPGDIVRILENFLLSGSMQYEQELYASINRCPCMYNVWMLNRLINWYESKECEKYHNAITVGVEFLRKLYSSDIDDSLKDDIADYLEDR